MTPIATPNGLAVAGGLFLLSGLAILGAALLNRTGLARISQSRLLSAEKLHVSAWFALPMIAAGFFLQAAGNMVTVALGSGISCLLLALAFLLLMYLLLDETIADALGQGEAVYATPRQSQFALPPPAAEEPGSALFQPSCEQNGIGHAI